MTAILVSEVGPRDGLQSIDRVMPLAAKQAWIAAEAAAGVREIEVGSFVPAALLPQMADTAALVAFALTIPHLKVVALVPNARGAALAAAARVHAMSVPFSMSETHSLRNVRKDHPAMLAEIAAIAAIAKSAGSHFAVGLPAVPIAIPTSACASPGASFTPSPAIATLCPFACNSFTIAAFPSGKTSACTSSMPSVRATASAVERLSPVNMAT